MESEKHQTPGSSDSSVTMNQENGEQQTFPEGGTRAWLVVLGSSCVAFASFGYVNTFG